MSMCELNCPPIMKLSDLVNDTQTERARALTRMMDLAVRHSHHPYVSIPKAMKLLCDDTVDCRVRYT